MSVGEKCFRPGSVLRLFAKDAVVPFLDLRQRLVHLAVLASLDEEFDGRHQVVDLADLDR